MFKQLLAWNDVTAGMLIVLVMVCALMHYTIFTFMEGWPDETQEKINKVQATCLVKCESKCDKVTKLRDDSYYTTGIANAKKCIFTLWEFSHFLFHIAIGYYYNIYASVGISVGYEIYEHYVRDCGSLLDLIWNFSGFLVGTTLRYGF
jgi:hypothetical protein